MVKYNTHKNWTLLIELHINASYYVHRDVHHDVHRGVHYGGLHDDLDHKYGWWILDVKDKKCTFDKKNIWRQKEKYFDDLYADRGEFPLQPLLQQQRPSQAQHPGQPFVATIQNLKHIC